MGNQPSFPDLEHQTVKYPNGDVYVGQIRDGKRHGYGEYKGVAGHQYAGQWRVDLRHGRGELTLAATAPGRAGKEEGAATTQWAGTYEGNFERNQRSGRGKFTAPDGSVYVGGWKADLKHGEGVLILENSTITGTWAQDELHGSATIENRDESELVGNWTHGAKDGLFILTSEESIVEQVWVDGLLVHTRYVDDLDVAEVLGVEDQIIEVPPSDEHGAGESGSPVLGSPDHSEDILRTSQRVVRWPQWVWEKFQDGT